MTVWCSLAPGRCDECGFDYGAVSPPEAAAALRTFPRRYRAPLTRFLPNENGDEMLRRRPDPAVWSALDYAAHVAEAFRLHRSLLRRALAEERPQLPPAAKVATAPGDGHDAGEVARQIGEGAEALAALIEEVAPDDWDRRADYGDHGEVSALWFAANAVHEGSHHLLDMGRALRTARGR